MTGFDVRSLDVPVIIAPMAGGPTTPELAAAGSNAGGLGFLAGGYLKAEAFAERITAARALTTGPLGANLFVPGPSTARPQAIQRYAQALQRESERYSVRLGDARFDDDDWAAKLDVVLDLKPEVVSFTFGLPTADDCARLRGAGITTVATVTTLAEGELAVAVGVDAVAAQGPAAGGLPFQDAAKLFGIYADQQQIALTGKVLGSGLRNLGCGREMDEIVATIDVGAMEYASAFGFPP